MLPARLLVLLQLMLSLLLIPYPLKVLIGTYAIVQGEADTANKFPQVCALLDAKQNIICSGVLVSQTTLLTAAHCLERIALVSCNPEASGASVHYNITAQEGHPSHGDQSFPEEQQEDVAVITLGSPVPSSVPMAQLPTEWQLQDLDEAGQLDVNNAFTVVGYGSTQAIFDPDAARNTSGPQNTERYFTSANYISLDLWKLHISVALSRGEGGSICNGDSGGPVFLKESHLLVGLMVQSDLQCSTAGLVNRLDLPEVRSWLAEKDVITPDK